MITESRKILSKLSKVVKVREDNYPQDSYRVTIGNEDPHLFTSSEKLARGLKLWAKLNGDTEKCNIDDPKTNNQIFRGTVKSAMEWLGA